MWVLVVLNLRHQFNGIFDINTYIIDGNEREGGEGGRGGERERERERLRARWCDLLIESVSHISVVWDGIVASQHLIH